MKVNLFIVYYSIILVISLLFVLATVSCSHLIRQAIANHSSVGHACKTYVDKGMLGL